jgi:hypothetical protein
VTHGRRRDYDEGYEDARRVMMDRKSGSRRGSSDGAFTAAIFTVAVFIKYATIVIVVLIIAYVVLRIVGAIQGAFWGGRWGGCFAKRSYSTPTGCWGSMCSEAGSYLC